MRNCLFASTLHIFDRFGEISAAAVMMGQLVDMLFEPICEQLLDSSTRALVQNPSALGEYRVVRDLLGQRVLEGEFDVTHGRLLVDELRQLEIREHSFQFRVASRYRCL